MEEVEIPRHWTSYVDDIDLPLLYGIRLFPTKEAIKILWAFGNRAWRE